MRGGTAALHSPHNPNPEKMRPRVSMTKRWLLDRWGWVVVAGCCGLFFVTFGFMLAFSIVFVALQEEFGSTATQTAWVGSIPFGFCSICSPLISLLVERFGNRAVIATGTAISATGIIASSFMPSLTPMYFSFSFTYGFGAGMTMFGCFKLILAYFPFKNSTRAIVMPMACSSLGMFTMGPLTYFLQTRFGWRNMLRIMGSLIGVVSIPVCLVVLKPPSEPDKDHQRKTDKTCCASSDMTRYSEITSYIAEIAENRTMITETNENDSSRLNFPGEGNEVINDGDVSDKTFRKVEGQETDNKLEDDHKMESNRNPICLILGTLTYPDVVLFSFSVFGYGLVNSFVIIQLANFMLSVGHTEKSGTQAVMAMGVSIMIGKTLLVMFADRAPFPKLGFFLIASVIGIGILICLLFVHHLIVILTMTAILGVTVMGTADCLPYPACNHAFGVAVGAHALPVVSFFHGSGIILASLLGESVDKTGSYDIALNVCICAYALCGLFAFLVPVYQKCFVKDRFVMDLSLGWKKKKKTKTEKIKMEKWKPPWKHEEVACMITDRVSSV